MRRHGFSLIELMIVVGVVGILAALAIPAFTKIQCRSKQSEAKANLKAVATAIRIAAGDSEPRRNCVNFNQCYVGLGAVSEVNEGCDVSRDFAVDVDRLVNTRFYSFALSWAGAVTAPCGVNGGSGSASDTLGRVMPPPAPIDWWYVSSGSDRKSVV